MAGCSKLTKTEQQQTTVYSSQILLLVNSAIGGNKRVNDSLSNLIDIKLPANTSFNQVYIDSILNYQGKRLYILLLEHPIPIFNRFAIYDEKLRCFLLDKSLNGNLKCSVYRSQGEALIQVDENFISKDNLELVRRSLYLIKNDTVSLAFRNFIQLKEGEKSYIQNITSINKDSISTSINFDDGQEPDLFQFDFKTLKYISENEKFQQFVMKHIDSYSKPLQKPQIIDERTALEAIGMTPKEDTIANTNNFKSPEEGFSVFIPDEWKVIKNFSIPGRLKKQCKGTYFVNASKGSKFYVINIPEGDSAESYINAPFSKFVKGKYFVRFTGHVEEGNNMFIYFEMSCSSKKFLVFFEIPKFIYEDNKVAFESIINSFIIDC